MQHKGKDTSSPRILEEFGQNMMHFNRFGSIQSKTNTFIIHSSAMMHRFKIFFDFENLVVLNGIKEMTVSYFPVHVHIYYISPFNINHSKREVKINPRMGTYN